MTEEKPEVKEEVVEKKEEVKPVTDRLVKPHTLKSRQVAEEDVDRVVSESKILHELCFGAVGIYKGAYAMHHSQIDDKDPLDFFVLVERKIVINPVITRHSNYFKDSKEGCVTYNHLPQTIVPRWQKIDVEYRTIMVDPENKDKFKLSGIITEKLSGPKAFVFAHEYDHGKGKYIYPL